MDPGTVLDGRYRLDRRISTGGMGEVWAAHDVLLDRQVAVKLLREDLARDDSSRERFRAEARAAASLAHPGVVAVYDFGEHDGRTYLAMELVDGEPLSARLLRGPLGSAETMGLVAQAASALAAAHAAGLVHRDVKPGNLLIRRDGRLQVTDFGIVRSLGEPPRTEVGTVVGTVTYMSPEQVRGDPVTPASDLYSLGVVAFECLAGARPFPGDASITVALSHLHDPVPPLPAGVPPKVRRLVTALLEKDPARRPPSAAAVAVAAEGLAGPDPAAALDLTAARASTAALDLTAARASTAALASALASPPTIARTAARRTLPPSSSPAPWWPPSRRAAQWGAAAVALLAVLALTLGGVLGSGSADVQTTVTVPRLVTRPVGAATARARSLRLRPVTTTADIPGGAPGVVMAQLPEAGHRVRSGSRISLTVASGYVDLAPNSLDGLAQATAEAQVRHLGLVVTTQTTPSAATTGDVVSFSPSGRLAEGTTVSLDVASAIVPVTVPGGPGNGHGKGGPGKGGQSNP